MPMSELAQKSTSSPTATCRTTRTTTSTGSATGPVWREPNYGMFIITGHPEAMAVYGDPATFPPNDAASGTFSSCNCRVRVVRQALRAVRG